jgi:hypothetical protein
MLTTLATAAITVVVVNDFTGKHTEKRKLNFPHIYEYSEGIGCKVIYD